MHKKTTITRLAILNVLLTLSVILVLVIIFPSCGNKRSLDKIQLAPTDSPPPMPVSNDRGFKALDSVDVMPVFPGGDEALLEYISSNIVYPHSARVNGVQGRVLVKFVVEPDGRVDSLSILQGVDKELDEEALRLIKKLPKFEPGLKNGKRVAVNYVLPINFKLQ